MTLNRWYSRSLLKKIDWKKNKNFQKKRKNREKRLFDLSNKRNQCNPKVKIELKKKKKLFG